MRQNNVAMALEHFREALRLNPHQAASRALAERLETELKTAGRSKAMELNDRALAEYGNGRLEQAIALWEEALRQSPDMPEARSNLERARKEHP